MIVVKHNNNFYLYKDMFNWREKPYLKIVDSDGNRLYGNFINVEKPASYHSSAEVVRMVEPRGSVFTIITSILRADECQLLTFEEFKYEGEINAYS